MQIPITGLEELANIAGTFIFILLKTYLQGNRMSINRISSGKLLEARKKKKIEKSGFILFYFPTQTIQRAKRTER